MGINGQIDVIVPKLIPLFFQSNRAPYTMPFHTNWFTHPHQVKGLEKFIRWTLEKPDVYYLTATEVLLWMSDPKIEVLK